MIVTIIPVVTIFTIFSKINYFNTFYNNEKDSSAFRSFDYSDLE